MALCNCHCEPAAPPVEGLADCEAEGLFFGIIIIVYHEHRIVGIGDARFMVFLAIAEGGLPTIDVQVQVDVTVGGGKSICAPTSRVAGRHGN